jgi:transcriptional regulator with XRE-family HTH domain
VRYTPHVPRRKSVDDTRARSTGRPVVLRPLGAQVRLLRLERNLSQQALAGRAGLSYKYLGRIELALADPGAEVLVRLARALDVSVGRLFETITPTSGDHSYHLSPLDLDELSAAVTTVASIVDRVRTRKPRSVSQRASRRSG